MTPLEYQDRLIDIAVKLYPHVCHTGETSYTETVLERARDILDKARDMTLSKYKIKVE